MSSTLTGLTAASEVSASDLLYIVLNPTTNPISRRVALSFLLQGKVGSAEINSSIISGFEEEAAPGAGDLLLALVGGELKHVDIGNMAGITFSDPINDDLIPDEDNFYDIGSSDAAFASLFIELLDLAGSAIDAFLDENDLASDSASAIASQQSIKAYVDLVRSQSEVDDFTIAATHSNQTTRVSKATDVVVTFPSNATFNAPIGTKGILKQTDAGQIVFDDDGGATTIRVPDAFNLKSAQQWSSLYYEKVAADTWEIVGDLELKIEAPTIKTTTPVELALTDNSIPLVMDLATANRVDIPTEASVLFPDGALIPVWQKGAGITTIKAAVGVSLNGVPAGSADISAQYNRALLFKVDTDEWMIEGNHEAVIAPPPDVIKDDAASSTLTNTNETIKTASVTIGGGTNRKIIALVSLEDPDDGFTGHSVTFDPGGADETAGVQITGAAITHQNFTDLKADGFYIDIDDGVSGGTYDVQLENGVVVLQMAIGVFALSGAVTGQPEAVENDDGGGTASVINTTITTLADGAMVCDHVVLGNDNNPMGPDDGQTEEYEVNNAGAAIAGSTLSVATAGTVNTGWSWSGGDGTFLQVAVSIAPAS